MRKAFNKRLTLLRIKPATGRHEPVTEESVTVWADVSEPGVTTKMTALSVGQEISYTAILWRTEYKGYTHADYGGKRYKITDTGATDNPLHIRLILGRG